MSTPVATPVAQARAPAARRRRPWRHASFAIGAMLVGLVMAVGGGVLAQRAYAEDAPRTDLRYLIGCCTLGAGLLSFRRGYDRSND